MRKNKQGYWLSFKVNCHCVAPEDDVPEEEFEGVKLDRTKPKVKSVKISNIGLLTIKFNKLMKFD
jgi:hypothetical protein